MNLPKFSVNRPVTVIMIFLAIILLGLISWSKLPQELFPSITYPQITVVTSYENAAPEEIESLITKIIEEAVGTVNNVKRISSISKEGLSLVMAEFNWGTNMDFAALNVREKIDLIKERLPRESQEPIVMKYNPFDLPILNLAVTGPMAPLELRELCRKYIKDAIEKVEGVASASISGGDVREILVQIDQPRLRASMMSIVSVVDTLKSANVNYPAGTIKESFYEYLIRTMGEFQKVAEIKDTPAALDVPEEKARTQKEKEKEEEKGRRIIYLRDIAKVKDSVKEKNNLSRYNGKDSISVVVRKQSGQNTLNVVNGVKKEIDKLLEEKLPKGVSIQITYDQSQFIQEALSNLRNNAVQGAILSFIVLFLFLWEFKSSFIIITAIPISITATLCLMYFTKINLNMMSLGGLAIGVGMVIDSANVVIENIFRYRQLGKSFKEAIILGTQEMAAPIVGSTLTSVAVFLPFAFVVGIAGQIFKQLSFTITFSLIFSIIVAISLVPTLFSIGGRSKNEQKSMRKAQEITHKYLGWFEDFIVLMLEKKHIVMPVIFALFFLSLATLLTQNREFLPRIDQRQFIVKVDLAPGARLEITDRVVRKIENILLGLSETNDVTVNIGSSEEKSSAEETSLQTLGSHQAQILVNLKKKSKKQGVVRSTDDIIQIIKTRLEKQDIENAQIEYIAQETSLGAAIEQGAPIAIEIKGPDLNRLTEAASVLQVKLNKIPGVYGTKNNMPLPSPETKLHILKDKASLFGLSVRDIAVTTQVALKGYVATKFKEKTVQEDVDVRVRLRPEDRSDMGNLRRLLIQTPSGINIPLSEVAYFTKGLGPTEIKRTNQQRSILVTANVYKRSLNQIIPEVTGITGSLISKLSKDYSFDLAGEQQRMKESFASLAFALILAFTLVYMIMAGEFESFWQPFMIMFTVPLSLIGVTFALFITHTSLNVVAYLGIIMLGGIAVNNGIVLIDYINVLRTQGYSPHEAAIKASKTRLRPILMTSLTTILGLLPLALGIGEGAELQAPLALTVMGGLTSSTFLTLVFIPALYVIITERFEGKLIRAPEKELAEEPAPESLTAEFKPEVIQPAASLELSPQVSIIPEAPQARQQEPEVISPPVIPENIPQEKESPPSLPALTPGLNQRQLEILKKLKTINKITRKGYVDMFAVSIPTAARDLKELVEKKLLKAKGPLGPGRWYELAKEDEPA